MTNEAPDRRWALRLGIPASIALHGIAIALLVFGLPQLAQEPPKEQVTQVALVPPPKPPEKPPQKPKDKPPPEKPKVEKPKAEKPEQPKAEPPKPAPAPQPSASAPPASPPPPVRTLSPVVRFGEKDAGPKKDLTGDSAEEAAKPTEKDKPEPASAPPLVSAGGAVAAIPAPLPTKPKPAPRKTVKLDKARTLFSRSTTNDPVAMTAMANVPRPARAATLCVSELNGQLAHASPPYFADLLPSFPLEKGNVMDVSRAAFRSGGKWRDLSFRCEVDEDATRVMSFAFKVGDPIPREDWAARGLPGG